MTLKGQGRDAYSTVGIVHWLDLVLRFSGSAHVSWSEAQTTYIKGSAPTVSCRNNETFLHFSLSLLNKGIVSLSHTARRLDTACSLHVRHVQL